jgi:hypothetical protein
MWPHPVEYDWQQIIRGCISLCPDSYGMGINSNWKMATPECPPGQVPEGITGNRKTALVWQTSG